MIEKIQQKIDKFEVLEREAGNRAEFNLIGEFLGDLNQLLKSATEKKKECCAKKVQHCNTCCYRLLNNFVEPICGHAKLILPKTITDIDTTPEWCPLCINF